MRPPAVSRRHGDAGPNTANQPTASIATGLIPSCSSPDPDLLTKYDQCSAESSVRLF